MHKKVLLVAGVIQVQEYIKNEGQPLLDDMSGHPGMAKYIEQGFEIINF
ncbi:MAG: hypothetical protein K0A99_05620 [Desulfoarculaceae bacterium]|nr:hypothetical protein [Desulfoarculaceae bacterium]